MKKIFILLTILTFFLSNTQKLQAEETINKFGIHILNPEEIKYVPLLVNSNGGDWGLVTIVIRDDQQDLALWQKFFDDCRNLHLIPLVRIATRLEGAAWLKPTVNDLIKWINFFNQLNWPIKQRYLIIYNEPNHTKEWGGEINPTEYAQILDSAIKLFKTSNSDYQILNAGFDLKADNSKTTKEVTRYWQEMNQAIPGIFEHLDGWASHSYTAKDYLWEINYLKLRLPVFITETGSDNPKNTGQLIKSAYEQIWLKDPQVKAVTPFILYYPELPFINFSWLNKDYSPTIQYQTIANLSKKNWWPEQEFKLAVEKIILPPFIPTKTSYQGIIRLKNLGQSIWGEQGDLWFFPSSKSENLIISPLKITKGTNIEPQKTIDLEFSLQSGTLSGVFNFGWQQLPEFKIHVIPSSIITKMPYTIWQKIILKITKYRPF